MVSWISIMSDEDLASLCATLTNNCVAMLSINDIRVPGYVSVEEKFAFFVLPQQPHKIVKIRSGFFVLEDAEGNLEWQAQNEEHVFPFNAYLANDPAELNTPLYFGRVEIDGIYFVGAVYENGTFRLPISGIIYDLDRSDEMHSILVWKTACKTDVQDLENRMNAVSL
ncbi:Hypothetical predicted protein [Cloeon dipterum]|uniref:Uncharacterized protein n=1 Tax=Cloeon dipterum TaxID=197152 RepID=A0A8S1DTM4_9INSE|nr:Hypothetical predicted protein [Cloeon dipterum]